MKFVRLVVLLLLAVGSDVFAATVPVRNDSWYDVNTLPREDIPNKLIRLASHPLGIRFAPRQNLGTMAAFGSKSLPDDPVEISRCGIDVGRSAMERGTGRLPEPD